MDLFESIKQIALLAFKLRLIAVNAIVTSRAAGADAPGFDVVATYMGQLSKELDAAMARVSPEIGAWVHDASLLLKLDRTARLWARAGRLEDTGHAAAALERARRGVQELRVALVSRQKRVVSTLDDVGQLSAGGCGAARTAKVEAAYGGEQRVALDSVASDFARAADDVYAEVYTLRRRAAAPIGFLDEAEELERAA